MGESNKIVEDWLRSVNLVQYTQSFYDNGYDDLEVCKQIGEDDLDAIGVSKDEHRERLLRAVTILKEEGGTNVYFTLELECQSGEDTDLERSDEVHTAEETTSDSLDSKQSQINVNSNSSAVGVNISDYPGYIPYPPGQLKAILRDKLVVENIDLSGPPYTNVDLQPCGSSLTALAIRFAEELRTHFVEVLEKLEELWTIARSNDDYYSALCRTPNHVMYGPCVGVGPPGHPTLPVVYPQHPYSPATQPPPLPSCPPPSITSGQFAERCQSISSQIDRNFIRHDTPTHANYVALDGGVCCIFPRKIVKDPSQQVGDEKKKGGSAISRFFRNIGLRRSSRKGSYRQHQGDLNAYEMSMSDEDRMALMILVKEGKISTQTALTVVQRYEQEKKMLSRGRYEDGKENETPSEKLGFIGKKKKNKQPPKSQSTLSADDPSQQHQQLSSAVSVEAYDDLMGSEILLQRQRRVHSLSQLDAVHLQPHQHAHANSQLARVTHDSRLPQRADKLLSRAMSCSPACTPSHKNGSETLPRHPAQYHVTSGASPHYPYTHYHQQQHHHHHFNKMGALKERLTGRAVGSVQKTSSKTSLLSSGSDQSMECNSLNSHASLRTEPLTRLTTDALTYNSNSTVSMSSDNNSPSLTKKKLGAVDPRLKTNYSTGDDGISSENDDQGRFQHQKVPHKPQRANKADVSKLSVKPPLLRQHSAPVGNMPPAANSKYGTCVLGQARAVSDYSPNADEHDFLVLKKGDIINILNMAQSGIWLGTVGSQEGKFHFNDVEVLTLTEPQSKLPGLEPNTRDLPESVEDVLYKIGLGHLCSTFIQNGYDDLDIFAELDASDLDTLHITNSEQRNKLLSAARVLVDWQEKSRPHTPTVTNIGSPSSRAGNSSCDSGCYTGDGSKQANNVHGSSKTKPCHTCGKPKHSVKLSGPVPTSSSQGLHSSPYSAPQFSTFMPSSPATASQHAPGYPKYISRGHYGTSINRGVYGYASSRPEYSQYYPQTNSMSGSRTLTELTAGSGSTQPSTEPGTERASLTEEDQEIIAITYGTSKNRKMSIPERSMSVNSSRYDIYGYNPYAPSSVCSQCMCPQCAVYSCPQCVQYHHYVNTSTRSESKSSKMSCSSTCTQTTCLSPEHEDPLHFSPALLSSDNSRIYSTNSYSPYRYSHQNIPISANHFQVCQAGPPQGKMNISHHDLRNACYPEVTPSPQIPISVHGVSAQNIIPGSFSTFQSNVTHQPGPQTPSPQVKQPSPQSTAQIKQPVQRPSSTQSIGAAKVVSSSSDASLAQTEKSSPSVAKVDDEQPLPRPLWSQPAENGEALGMANLYRSGVGKSPDKKGKSDNSQKSPTRSLRPLVSTKLVAEGIDLSRAPYTSENGECGIPPLLVQRYSEELRQELDVMALVLEQIREKQLRELAKPCVPNGKLAENCSNACDLQITSIQEFLVSIGLPMYIQSLKDGSVTSLDKLLHLPVAKLEQLTGADSRHLKRIAHALEWVKLKLSSPGHKAVSGPTDKV